MTEDIIRKRRSVRTFDGRALSDVDVEKILDYSLTAKNPYDIPIEWRILSAGRDKLKAPVISGADTYIAGKMKKTPHAEEAFGFSFERIVLYAQSVGIGTTWIAGTMDREGFERAVELADGEVMPCVSPLGYPAAKMSLRETVMRKGVGADSRLPFESLFFDGSFDKPLKKSATSVFGPVFEAVRLSPSAVNKQPWRLVIDGDTVCFYEKRSRGYVKPDGWDLQKVDIGIAMCHFAAMCEENGIETEFVIDDPGLAVPVDTFYIASYKVKVP